MGRSVISKLDVWGPGCEISVSTADAMSYCRSLTLGHYENFSVLSRFVPESMRGGVCATYAFCRWADDLADESPDRETALERLAWWRKGLEQCFAGDATHPVFIALLAAHRQYELPPAPFHRLLDAFERDQRQSRWETWEDLVDYCAGSADPVGRLVLQLGGARQDASQLAASDAICTGLQLANHWQDVKRDLLERDRIYIPLEAMPDDDFAERLAVTVRQGHAPDQTFMRQFREVMAGLVQRTRPLFAQSDALISSVEPQLRPMLRMFASGGQAVLDLIERIDHETVLHRVSVSKVRKVIIAWRSLREGRAA